MREEDPARNGLGLLMGPLDSSTDGATGPFLSTWPIARSTQALAFFPKWPLPGILIPLHPIFVHAWGD
jgi:hypothetical protein